MFISPHFTQHWRVFISHSKRKKVKELIHSRQLSGTIYVTLRHNLGAKYQPKSGTGQGSTCNTESRNKIPPQQKLSKMEVSFTPDNQNHPEPRPGLFHWTIPVHKVPKQNGPRQSPEKRLGLETFDFRCCFIHSLGNIPRCMTNASCGVMAFSLFLT